MTTDIWNFDLLNRGGAKYLAIAEMLADGVSNGHLRGGDRLPPQRELASKLGVDLTTITKAYDVARERGLIEARGRLGSFVREPGDTQFTHLHQVDTGMNMPPELPEGAISRAIANGTVDLLRHAGGARLQYQPPGGALQDRIAGAQWLSACCAPSLAEQVVLTAGGQNALHAILCSSFEPGDAIACGTYVYSGMKALAARLGLRLVPLPDMSAAALEEAIARDRVRAIYIVPTNDNPTGKTLSASDREAIAALATDRGLQVIEDDAYGALANAPLPTIASFAPDRSWHIASTSKIISPGLRVAFVRAPSTGAALSLAADVHETAIMAPPINAALVSSWIGDGRLGDLIAAMRREVRSRRAIADDELPNNHFSAHPEGYHLWVPVREGQTGRDLADALGERVLPIVPAERFAVDGAPDNAIRVSLGGLLNADALRRSLRILAGHLNASGGSGESDAPLGHLINNGTQQR